MSTKIPTPSTAGPPWWLLLLAAAGIAAGLYLWQMEPVPRLPARATAPSTSAPADGPADAPPETAPVTRADAPPSGPKYPLPDSAQAGDPAAMPAVEQSDTPILDALLSLAQREQFAQFFNLQEFARRFVVTVDHLPRTQLPAQWSAARPMQGHLVVERGAERITLKAENFERYDAFVQFAESLDPKAMARVYLRFYPLLQQQYRELGFPDGHLNDRVVAAIDDMLTAPEVSGPIRLVQPKVQYRFEDPLLESLSAGRKIMIRVGPEHAGRIKTVLRAIREQIVR